MIQVSTPRNDTDSDGLHGSPAARQVRWEGASSLGLPAWDAHLNGHLGEAARAHLGSVLQGNVSKVQQQLRD